MSESYTLQIKDGKLLFAECANPAPEWLKSHSFSPAKVESGVSLASRMGDPEGLNCVAYRKTGVDGGNFAIFFGSSFLFAANADANLAFALGLGFFGELTANARYGADVFENMELPDD